MKLKLTEKQAKKVVEDYKTMQVIKAWVEGCRKAVRNE